MGMMKTNVSPGLPLAGPLARPGHGARLAALRAELARRKLDGLIVPRGDEHLGEYVPARAERLRWLTGFSGSAGLAVILAGKAGLFVDGRYTLQVRGEADDKDYAFLHIPADTPAKWIEDNLGKGRVLGYDPWLLTRPQAERYREAARKAGGDLRATDGNPIDAVWTDQPPPPLAPAVPQATKRAGQSSAQKRRRLGAELARQGIDAAVLAQPDSIAWLLNLRGADVPYSPLALGFAVLGADASVGLFMDARKITPALARRLGPEVQVLAPGRLEGALGSLGKARKTVAVDPDATPDWIFERLLGAGAVVRKQPDPCLLPKAVKNAAELAGMRGAHIRDGAAMVRFLAWLDDRAGGGDLTEMAAAARIDALRAEGDLFKGLSFPTISGSGPNGAIVHYGVSPATDRALRPGELYLVDSGAQYLDGTTDVTRTVAIGKPSNEMKDRFSRVLKGHIAIADARFPEGTTGSQLDPLARRALWAAGLDYDHGTGHGVGSYLSVHEGPQRISKAPSKIALQPGMVLSNEPGYYKQGAYGIRIENLLAVIKIAPPDGAERRLLGFETLTHVPIDRRLVKKSLLSRSERTWLDAYHARVAARLRPALDRKTRKWLAQATAPI